MLQQITVSKSPTMYFFLVLQCGESLDLKEVGNVLISALRVRYRFEPVRRPDRSWPRVTWSLPPAHPAISIVDKLYRQTCMARDYWGYLLIIIKFKNWCGYHETEILVEETGKNNTASETCGTSCIFRQKFTNNKRRARKRIISVQNPRVIFHDDKTV